MRSVLKKPQQNRIIFEGWNNLTAFEIEMIAKARAIVEGFPVYQDLLKRGDSIPDCDLLRYLIGYNFDFKALPLLLENYINWRIHYLPCKLTQNAIRLMVNYLLN